MGKKNSPRHWRGAHLDAFHFVFGTCVGIASVNLPHLRIVEVLGTFLILLKHLGKSLDAPENATFVNKV